jgi:CBS domain-containing protein
VIALRVEGAGNFDELHHACKDIVDLARSLFAQRVNVRFIMDLLAEIHRRILARNFDLLVPEHIRAETCLLVLGSEGRGEQVMRTDQSNALVLGDGLDWPDRQEILQEFSARTEKLGYPPSPRRMVVSNPEWALTGHEWRQRLEDWSRMTDEESVLGLSAVLDATPIAGARALFNPLGEWLGQHLPRDPQFFARMLKPVLKGEEAPVFFESGSRRGREIDVKQHGIFPLVHCVRVLSLDAGISACNTFRRLDALREAGVLDQTMADDLIEALLLFNRMRLARQLRRLEDSDANKVPANVVNMIHTEDLSSSELALLREALREVRALRNLVAERYSAG